MQYQNLSLDPEHKTLSMTAGVEFEAFDSFAEPLCRALDAKVLERQWGADRHQWLLDLKAVSCGSTMSSTAMCAG